MAQESCECVQAWKGDVTKLSNDTYSLTNKCFNNELYPCQCLELGYLIRYQPGNNPSAGSYYLANEPFTVPGEGPVGS